MRENEEIIIEQENFYDKTVELFNEYGNIFPKEVYSIGNNDMDNKKFRENRNTRELISNIIKEKKSPLYILLDNDLQFKFREFNKIFLEPPNYNTLLSKKFIDWLKSNPRINSELIERLNLLCKTINNNNIIEKAIIHLINNTNLSLRKIIQKLSWYGIILKRSFMERFANSYLQDNFSIRFPSGKPKTIEFDLKKLDFSNLLNTELSIKFVEFYNFNRNKGITGKISFANTGRIIRDDFFNWLNSTIDDFYERIKFLEMCETINQEREIPQYILHLLINSNLSQLEVVDEFKRLGLYVSRETVRKIGLENLSKKKYDTEFKRGIKSYKYSEKIDLSQLKYNSLLKPELQQKFREFYSRTGKYANDGRNIRREFMEYLNETVRDFKGLQSLLKLCNDINSNKEIEKFIIAMTLKKPKNNIGNQLSLSQISELIDQFGLNVDRMTVARVALQHIFNNDNVRFSERFPSGGQPDIRYIDFSKLEYNNLLQIKDILKRFYAETNNYPNQGISLTPYFMDWIINNVRDSKKREKILSICNLINNNSEILKLVIDLVINTRLNLEEIRFKIREYGLDVSRGTISRHAQTYIFRDNTDEYNKRFPMDFDKLKGELMHTAVRYLLTDFFNRYYKSIKYYSEIMGFPPSRKRADGIILNLEPYDFLSRRFRDNIAKRYLISEMNLTLLNTLNIQAVQTDLTNDLSIENLDDKIQKYQSPYLLLIIISTNIDDKDRKIPINLSLKSNYIYNVRIIGYSIFSRFIGLEGRYKDIFNKIMEYNNLNNLEGLKSIIEQFTNIQTYNTENLKHDIGSQRFNEIFKDYQPIKDITPKSDSEIFSSFIHFCSNSNLAEKEITRGQDKGRYYIFTSENLNDFKYNIGIDNLSLDYLSNLAKKFNKDKYIFYKPILLYNPTLKKEVKKRVVLINKPFLDRLKFG